MIVECHVILTENLVKSFDENFDESFIIFCFDLAIENHYDSTDQNFYSVVEFYFFFLNFKQIFFLFKICHNLSA